MRKRGGPRKRVRPRERPNGISHLLKERGGKKYLLFEYFLLVFLFVCLVILLVKMC